MQSFTTLLTLVSLPLQIHAFSVQSAKFLGNVTTNPNDNSVRGNGYSGKIGKSIIATFGDSFQCNNATQQTGCGYPNYFIYTNAAGLEESPMTFADTPMTSAPSQFCPYYSDEDPGSNALGVSNVVPTNATAGVVYTFSYRRNIPGNNNPPSIGAGVGSISLSNGVPNCTRLSHNWWSGLTEPWYGVNSAWLSADGKYIHALGPANTTNAGGDYLYMARVPVGQATILGAYQYWNGTAYQNNRITAGKQYALVDTSGNALVGVAQGQGMYSTYLKQYIYCDRSGFDYNVNCRTSANPQGPFASPVAVFSSTDIGGCGKLPDYNGETYAPSLHPWYDDSQKSIVMWFTCGPNIIQAVNVTFA